MKRTLTYPNFLRAVAGYSIADLEDFVNDVSRSFQLFPEYQSYIWRYSGIYMIAYPLNKYMYVNEQFAQMGGTSVADIKANGLGQNEKKFYKPDEIINDEKIFVDNLDFFKALPVDEHPHYMMSSNYRIFNQERELRNVLQESFFINSAAYGMPLVALGVITDISHIRNDNRICSALYNANGEIRKEIYYSNTRDEKLSPRQIEIIKLVSNGL